MITEAAIPTAIENPFEKIYCKLLLNRTNYIPCHIRVPDTSGRLAGIALDGRFYSFFKVLTTAEKAVAVAIRLSKRDEAIAMTFTQRGYVIWIYEPQAHFAPPAKEPRHSLKPAFGPPACLILGNTDVYRECKIIVSDLDKPIEGICYQEDFYSIFRRSPDAEENLRIAAKLSQQGDDVLLIASAKDYLVAVHEPTATIAT